ncbi:11138_t:CDS:1 [Funneliformis mosseae]|uniref:11138_t:CDS:1 n=1 Tax=Funneliformis mosseae TaxID=27381 RepID=A0A9N9CT94_FUNMO|nr:11138_t:CDS:1 [Funneliformis mosseae]
MFLLKRQAWKLPFKGIRRVSYRNVHQKPSENSTHNTNSLKYYGIATTILGAGVITLFYGFRRKGQQTYNSSSLNDNEEDGGRNNTIIRSPREATAKLRENQISFLLQRSNGIWRYDSNQLGSNYPVEDMKSEEFVFNSPKRSKVESTVGDRLFFGVFDGHGGWTTSKLLSKKLIPKVKENLDKAIEGIGEYSNLISDNQELNKKAIERAFVELDEEVVIHSINKLLNTKGLFSIEECLLSALSGSCALLAYIDAANKDLYIACTGDSRAVLGVKETDNEKGGKRWKAVALSEDQTGRNENEVKRIDKEHPGEEGNIILNGRVFGGLEPTRAFGDSKYKWDMKMQDGIFTKFFKIKRGLAGGSRNKTPPYVTARPEVTCHKLTENDKFLVLATDGLWDELSNEEVVELVGEFLDGRRDIIDDKENPPILKEDELKWENYKQEKAFTFVDENASTHLIRNAYGGAKQDQVCALLSLPSPISRRFVDDITVTVVFFGPDNQSNKKVQES